MANEKDASETTLTAPEGDWECPRCFSAVATRSSRQAVAAMVNPPRTADRWLVTTQWQCLRCVDHNGEWCETSDERTPGERNERAELKAMYKSEGGWGEVGSEVTGPRYTLSSEPTRKRYKCFCGTRATHDGFANGVGLTHGCEFHMAMWVRNPNDLLPLQVVASRENELRRIDRKIQRLQQRREVLAAGRVADLEPETRPT